MKKTHDCIYYYRGYWSDGGKCRIRIYQEDRHTPVIICSQLPDNYNTSVTNMAEYLAAEMLREHSLATPLIWVEHYPRARRRNWRILPGEVLRLGTSRGMPRGCVALSGGIT